MTPNQPATPARSIRVPDDQWDRLREIAHAEGISASDLVREAIREWLVRHDT